MDWLTNLSEFLLKLGITGGAVVGAIWAATKVWGEKWASLYFKKQEEAHKQSLQHHFKERQQTLAHEQNVEIEKLKAQLQANAQQRLEVTKGMISAQVEATKAGGQLDLAKTNADLNKTQQLLEKQAKLEMETLKAGLDLDSKTRLSISERRLQPYIQLWSLMKPLSPRVDKPLDRSALETAFRDWYYNFGNGLFLSWAAMDAYTFATNLLSQKTSDIPDDTVRKAFSVLRTQMKIDMSVYTSDEGMSQVGSG